MRTCDSPLAAYIRAAHITIARAACVGHHDCLPWLPQLTLIDRLGFGSSMGFVFDA